MADSKTTKMTAVEAVDFINVWGEAELKKATSHTTAGLTNAAFAGYAARLAQKAASWAADTAQEFMICPPDEAIDREPAMRFVSEMRRLLDHLETQVQP